MKDYFINCNSDKNLIAFSSALSYQTGNHLKADETPKDVIARHCGDTSVEQIWENQHFVMFLSVDSHLSVMNLVEKKDDRTMKSWEVA